MGFEIGTRAERGIAGTGEDRQSRRGISREARPRLKQQFICLTVVALCTSGRFSVM
jgi:hypothetical protein